MRFRATLAFRHALLATCDRGPSDAGLLEDAALAVDDRVVGWIGPDRSLAEKVDLSEARQVDVGGRLVTPGLVDSHTHLLFGTRIAEQARELAGRGDLARAGAGILATAAATRAEDDGALVSAAIDRARRLLAQGVTTVEVKSGYGLSIDQELRLLRLLQEMASSMWSELTIVPTLLAAHAVPPEHADHRSRWVDAICEEIVPAAARKGLAAFCDAFAGEGAFSLEEARRVLEAGARHGLAPRLHADELASSGGARLAAEMKCATADHLEQVDDAGMAGLARSGTVACLLPASTLLAGLDRYAPARSLLAAGVPVALATHVSPGSPTSGNVGLTWSLACQRLGLTPAEALVAFTAGGARALRLAEAGRLAVGSQADLVIWGCDSLEHLPGHAGVSHALVVVKRGRVVHRAQPGAVADCAVR